MSKIELGLHEHHAAYQASNPEAHSLGSTQGAASSSAADQGLIDIPFVRVNTVTDGSPADEAGLKAGDRIRNFGGVNWMNHENLSKIAETVQRSQGVGEAVC